MIGNIFRLCKAACEKELLHLSQVRGSSEHLTEEYVSVLRGRGGAANKEIGQKAGKAISGFAGIGAGRYRSSI